MRFLLASLAVSIAGLAHAQDLPFSGAETEACLASAEADRQSGEECIGKSADACIASPDGYTTVGMGFCYSQEASYWDDRLNTAFSALMAVERRMLEEIRELGGTVPDAPSALRDMQRAWIGYRDASCAYEYTTWGGGTGGGPANAACLMFETGRQALLLERRLKDRAQ